MHPLSQPFRAGAFYDKTGNLVSELFSGFCKTLQQIPESGYGGFWFIAGLTEAQVKTCTCDWGLEVEEEEAALWGRGPFTFRVYANSG